ncbi:MAG TPA: UDP-glucose/GDP-mannose dehydrogenase family protein [Quisquiliibacterium sp.]|nr:UDP-glucose/GDP-mannose dehydrogenase family protein [Quisquiliibacterium sp.]HPA88441.1 UDP-glucose/GDP-mannose dehydrogenase family protein [Quisquiliibacterium sp.]HQD82228.1 UDP-glucose/GDP-mannose dehydrogenase family protein [Quisquiliibacterium sp.]HQN11347.1 UDP-glucose/GDP-mannose dehydrogenase family protein [Quisquiliibacterium sp.]HQP67565.1 UDP-glucose/GDP-mannose dehydrogenase family protein [Quisquiliibacterium sp.]
MRISVFGLGYVGVVSAACLATDGHVVVGVDPNETKVDQIASGRSPIVETDIDEMVRAQVAAGRLSATMDVAAAVRDTELSLICVGTPSQGNGSLDLKYVARVCEQIGAALAHKSGFHVVVARSTMLPGTMRDLVIPTLERCSGKVAGRDFGVCGNPEFLREGTAVYDYRNPPKTVIGETDARSGDVLASVYAGLKAPLIRTDVDTAEMVKYADNVWHALKVCFANEIGNVCKALAIDSHRVMDIFCQDTKLNLSPYYLKPGFAFGGSCLPKDVRALSFKARTLDVPLPVIGSILESNELQIRRGVDMIMARGSRRIGVLGFSFKAGTDDLRESPMVEVIERLIGKGYDLRLYDRNVAIARLTGANRDFILNHIPHISRLMVDSIDDVLAHGDTIVVGNGAREFADVGARLRDGQALVDFVRIAQERSNGRQYDGICW